MNHEHDHLEGELRRLTPRPIPPALRQRLQRQLPRPAADHRTQRSGSAVPWWRWLLPASAATALAVAALISSRSTPSRPAPATEPLAPASHSRASKEEVHIDRRLVADFDAVGRLATGEPVRFRCREWQEAVTIKDSSNNTLIERTLPRVEILTARYDTY